MNPTNYLESYCNRINALEKRTLQLRSFTLLVAFLIIPFSFLKFYFFSKRFSQGRFGFIDSLFEAFSCYLQVAKQYEEQHASSLDLQLMQKQQAETTGEPISVYIVTFNEEKFLPTLLESTVQADEVIIVDSGSTDKTLTIAQSYSVKVISRPWKGFADQKQFALEQCSNAWVLSLDADEYVPASLWSEFQQFTLQNKFTSMRFLRNDFFMGKPMPSLVKKAHNNRFFIKQYGHYFLEELAHENPKVKGKEFFSKKEFYHFGYNKIESLMAKLNNYSSLKAHEIFLANKSPSLVKLILIFPLMLFKNLFINRYVLMGNKGLCLTVIYSFYSFLKQAKLYQSWHPQVAKQHYEQSTP